MGSALTSTNLTDTLSKDSTTGQADLVINGVDIYDDTMSAASNTFQGKLDLINAFSDDTNVVASAYYEQVIDTSSVTFISNNTVSINGKSVDYGASLSALVTNINAVKSDTGVTAEAQGNNLILRGDGVQNVNIVNNDYTVATSVDNPSDVLKTKVTAQNSRGRCSLRRPT